MVDNVKVHQLPRLTNPVNVVYQAYGLQEILRQTLFSVLSLLYQLKDAHSNDQDKIKILIYTDNKTFFTDFFGNLPQLVYEVITTEKIKIWRGDIDFVHRVKIEVLRDARSKYKGDLFYLDGDTYFTEPPLSLFSFLSQPMSGVHSLMHELEGRVSDDYNPVAKKVRKFLQSSDYPEKEIGFRISPETDMWNAGVLGISEKNLHFLDEVLFLTDEMHKKYKKHVIEQFAFSYVLQKKGQVHAAPLVAHYWRNKEAFNTFIESFLTENPNFSSAFLKFPSITWPTLNPERPSKLHKFLKKLGL